MKKIIQNISLNFVMKIISYLFSFLTIVYVTRIFSPDLFGSISFSITIISYFLMFSSLGIPIYAMRLCIKNKNNQEELNKVFNEMFSINFILSIICFLLLLIFIFTIPSFIKNKFILLIYGMSILLNMIGCEWLYKGLEKYKFLTISLFITKMISFLGIILLVKSPNDYLIYIFLFLLASYGVNIIYFFNLKKYVNFSFKLHINVKHFKPLLVFFLMSCSVAIYSNLDIIFLNLFKGDYVTGLYAIIGKTKTILTMIGGIFWVSILPKATTLYNEKKYKDFESLTKKVLFIIFLIQFLVTILCFIFAHDIIFIIGGSEYLPAVNAFKITLFSLIPIGLSNILGGQVLIPTNNENKLLTSEIIGAVFNFLSNLVIIPFFSLEGAALTTVISEIIVWILCLYFIKKNLNINLYFIIKLFFSNIYKLLIVINSKVNKNSKYYCPCCNTKLINFKKGNFINETNLYNPLRYKDIKQDVICPICNSLPRHRIIVSYLNNHINEIRNKQILHFAQEKSIKIWLDNNNIDYISADLNKKANLKLNIEDTKLKDSSIDIIICNHVLEHVSNYDRALNELHRIIKHDGLIILSFPIDLKYDEVYEDKTIISNDERIKYFGQFDHLRIFGKNSKKLLRKYGFIVKEITKNEYDKQIKGVVGPADYDSNIIYLLHKK